MENNHYSSSDDSSMDRYSDSNTYSEDEWLGTNPDHHRGFETPHGSLSEDEWIEESFSEENSNVATSGEQIDNLSEPITDNEDNGTQTVPRPRPVRRIEMFSDEEDLWEFDDGTVHDNQEGDTDDDSHNYGDEEPFQLTDQQLELIDEIDFTNDCTKSKIVTATCAYTLEENEQCICCHKCGDTYSAEGLIENHSYHLPMERLCCPTCKTPIETALLISLLGKDETLALIKQQWDERMTTPIYEAYIDTIRLLHDADLLHLQENRRCIINLVRWVLSLINGHEIPIPIECPHDIQAKVLSLFDLSEKYRAQFDTNQSLTEARIKKILANINEIDLTHDHLRKLLYKPFDISSRTIISVIRIAKMISYTILRDHPIERDDLLIFIDDTSIMFEGWRYEYSLRINTPSEIIGMVYQQITETGTVTHSLVKLISDRGYSIFKRHHTPLTVLLNAIIDALVPNASKVQRKIIDEILKCGTRYNPFTDCPVRFLKSLSKGEATCTCGGPIISHVCLLCDQHYCEHCEEPINGFHQCSQDKLSSIAAINNISIKCPKCYSRIQKSEGCDHMYCTQCHCNFDWITGKVIKESEQTNDMYVNELSTIERDYIYYIRALIEDYESYIPSDLAYHKSALGHELSAIHADIYDERKGTPSITLRPHLNTILKNRIAKETIAALRPAVANAIQNTLDILSGTLNDYEADAVAERIVQRGIIALRDFL
jgi:hypothetical protein